MQLTDPGVIVGILFGAVQGPYNNVATPSAAVDASPLAALEYNITFNTRNLLAFNQRGESAFLSGWAHAYHPWLSCLLDVTGTNTNWSVKVRNIAPVGGPTVTPVMSFAQLIGENARRRLCPQR